MDKLTHFLRELIGIIGGVSVYSAAGLTVAGTAALLVVLFPQLNANPYLVFLFAFCIPPGILYLWNSSERRFERYLAFLKKLKEDDLIRAGEYDLYRKMALRWYAERRFGRAGLENPSPEEDESSGKRPGGESKTGSI